MFKALQRRVLAPSLVLVESRRCLCTTRCTRDKPDRPAVDQEDKDELERERQLRERFSQKIEGAMPQYAQQGPGNCSSGTCGPQATSSSVMFFRFMFFLTSLFLLLGISQLTDANSPFNLMQNMPWWQLPISSVSYFTLMRALLPYREQRRIKEEYEAASRLNPSLTLDQFFAQRYPTMFQGYHTQQQEVVAAVSACLSSANDLNFFRSISRAAGSARDIRASVDNIIDTLRREYPQLFQNNGTTSLPSVRV
ncbi:uncharacterized protein Tco025E_02283 [Trypanosoma conorhini]|uniref:Uncharacterized protein n=1 Tax=Trypanosoma conorhini TaxID=83891 RepID=A0A3S5IUB3_9TRYP|nr:uncharacterized protein Tco025E_02283 [Trypanosoma conorhini]RNF25135.1 hypothetical protein Tco025E_02283 [Trypanosoma conorhini]